MALYGVTDADESKPKWAVRGSGVDPQNIFSTADGWVLRHYKNAAKTALNQTTIFLTNTLYKPKVGDPIIKVTI